MIHIYEITYLFTLLAICAFHTPILASGRPVSPVFHLVWLWVYFIPVWVIWTINGSNELVAASVLIRFVFYNPALNLFRNKPFFYLSVNSRNLSLWDRVEIAWKELYPWIWGMGFLGLIIIQFLF